MDGSALELLQHVQIYAWMDFYFEVGKTVMMEVKEDVLQAADQELIQDIDVMQLILEKQLYAI